MSCRAGPGCLVAEGALSVDGTRIEGAISQNYVTWSWSLMNLI